MTLGTRSKVETELSVSAKLRQVDVVFVIDATGSMASQIAEVKSRLKEFARKLTASEVRPSVAVGVVAYRDHPPEDDSFVTYPVPLSSDVEETLTGLDSLTATGGGDGPEAVLDGLDYALKQMAWRQHSHQVILLTGDAPPHGMGARYGGGELGGDHWPKGCPCGLTIEEITSFADDEGVIIYSVGVGDWDLMIKSFTDLAEGTGGEFVPLSQVDSLIDKILPLLEKELVKVAEDIETASRLSSGDSVSDIARTSGRSAVEIGESVERLKKKGIALSPEIDAELEAMVSGRTTLSRPNSLIRLGAATSRVNLPPKRSGRIKLK